MSQNVRCPCCKSTIVANMETGEQLKKRYPNGCPLCKGPTATARTGEQYDAEVKRIGAQFVDHEGIPLKIRKEKDGKHT